MPLSPPHPSPNLTRKPWRPLKGGFCCADHGPEQRLPLPGDTLAASHPLLQVGRGAVAPPRRAQFAYAQNRKGGQHLPSQLWPLTTSTLQCPGPTLPPCGTCWQGWLGSKAPWDWRGWGRAASGRTPLAGGH